MTGPGYDVLLAAHVLSAVIGFGAVAASGVYAARGRKARDPLRERPLLRYFRPGTNWAARCLLLTPILGGTLLWAGDRAAASEAWPWIGLGFWALAAAVAGSWCWPAERRIQEWLDAVNQAVIFGQEERPPPELESFRDSCLAVERSASAISLCFLAAVVVMIAQPR